MNRHRGTKEKYNHFLAYEKWGKKRAKHFRASEGRSKDRARASPVVLQRWWGAALFRLLTAGCMPLGLRLPESCLTLDTYL